MFYAEISKDLKALALEATRSYLETGVDDAGGKTLVELAPYLLGFIGVHVDYPQSDFHRGIDERKWYFSDVTDTGYFFEGVEHDGDEDRMLFIPAGQMRAMRFMFRDATTEDARPKPRLSQMMQPKPPARHPRSSSPAAVANDDDSVQPADRIRPGMFRDGEDVH